MALIIDKKKIRCRFCGSQRVVRNGTGGKVLKPQYLCRACGRSSRKPWGINRH